MRKTILTFMCCLAVMAAAAKDVYMFSYFRGEKDGLHLAYSYDGLTWTALNDNKPVLKPAVGPDKLMRDPSIVQGPDGIFRMVWTSGWHDRSIGYASSPDLVNWSVQSEIPVMADEPEAMNCWAPELYYDEASATYYIFWATTIPGRHSAVASSEAEKQWNHRIYYTTTKDFNTFSKTKLFFNPDFNVIDAAIVRDPVAKNLIMVLKNENSAPAEKNIRITSTKNIAKGFPTKVSAPITGDYWAEGPAPLFVGDTLMVYFDKYTQGHYGAVCSVDHGKTWKDISGHVSFPKGIRHGTAFRVDESVLESARIALGDNPEVTWDGHGLIMGGRRVVPVMGEIHYSRVPADEWQIEIRKMKDGGVNIIACYVFWNHIEEIQNQYDWSGQRNLRRFIELCKAEGMPVVLRVGPFCHGEVRGGGIPDWVENSGCKIRSEDPQFLGYVAGIYRQIFTQLQGLQWKDGGPVVACQFDNEFGGDASYLLKLKEMAMSIGYDLPFYTRTGWPELKTSMKFGEMIPLYGDYADGFWDRKLDEGTGEYYKAFNFREFRGSTAIATEQLGKQEAKANADAYPYFTCELGGGMMVSYSRRVYLYPEDAYSMALVKLGSGSNLLGYYMYHGGTNPEGKLTYLNETQRATQTNYNDLPVKTYDFQAPLNELGLRNPHFYSLRKLHIFMNDYGELLAPMDAVFPTGQNLPQGDDSCLRWTYRTDGTSAFVFVNNYERFYNLSPKKSGFEVCGVKIPEVTIPSGVSCIFPVNVDGIEYATGQLVARRNGKIYMAQIDGIPTTIAVDGKVLRNVRPQGTDKPVYGNIYLLTSYDAGRLFLQNDVEPEFVRELTVEKIRQSPSNYQITIGINGVAQQPLDEDFGHASVYRMQVPAEREGHYIELGYYGDVARVYANGKLIHDNFYNGRPLQIPLWRLPKDCSEVEVWILPIQPDMPVYFPREAAVGEAGEHITNVKLIKVI